MGAASREDGRISACTTVPAPAGVAVVAAVVRCVAAAVGREQLGNSPQVRYVSRNTIVIQHDRDI